LWVNDVSKYLYDNDISNAKIKKTLFTIRKKILNILYGSRSFSDDYSVLDITSFGIDADIFWDKLKIHYDLIVERNKEYLNHRYCDKRAGYYIVKAIYRKNEMLGYCVVAIRDDKKEIHAQIIDFITLPDEHEAANTLLLETLEYLKKHNINSVDLWVVKNSMFYKLFKKNDFIQIKSLGPHIFLQEETQEMKEWDLLQRLNPDRTHFVMGDTDIC
jgi:plasmid maintenance system antidote protein VapI